MKGIGDSLARFTSRKFIATVTTQVVSLIVLFGVAPQMSDKIGQAITVGAALIAAVLAQATYVRTEGLIDQQSIASSEAVPSIDDDD